MEKLKLIDPIHLKLEDDGYGEFPDSYIVTEKGIKYIKEYLKKIENE